MAELGPINFTDLERGAVRPSEGREVVRGLGQTLDAVGQIHVADVLGDFTEDAQEVINEAREGATTATVFDAPSSLDGEEGRIQRRAGVLKAQIERGTSSQRALAELKLKQLLEEAKLARPALAQHLQQQMGNIVSTSAKLDEIGLVDSINAENARSAQQQLKAMVDHGTGLVENGGLGIDPSIPPNSAEFARQYAARQQARNIEQLHQLNVQLAATSGDMTAREKADKVNDALKGHGNIVNSAISKYSNEIALYRNELAKPAGQRNLAFMEDFAVNQRPSMVEELNLKKAEMMQSLDVIFPNIEERTSEYYGQVKAQFDDVVKHVDALIDAVSGDDLRAMDHVIAGNRIRATNFRRSAIPEFDVWSTVYSPTDEGIKPFFDTIIEWDNTGQNLIGTQRLANQGLSLLEPIIGNLSSDDTVGSAMLHHVFMNGGQGRINSTTPAPDIARTLEYNRTGTDGGSYGRNSTENDDLKTAIAELEMLRQKSYAAVETNSPFTAGEYMTVATNGLQVMKQVGNPSEDQIEITEGLLSDPQIFEASLLEGNSTNRNRRIALAHAAEDFLSNSEVNARKRRMQQELESRAIGNRPLLDYIRVKFTDEESDVVNSRSELTFEVKRDLLWQQANIEPETTNVESSVRAMEQQVISRVQPIMDQVNAQIRAAAHVDAMKQPTVNKDTLDYPNAADNEGWIDYFFRQGE